MNSFTDFISFDDNHYVDRVSFYHWMYFLKSFFLYMSTDFFLFVKYKMLSIFLHTHTHTHTLRFVHSLIHQLILSLSLSLSLTHRHTHLCEFVLTLPENCEHNKRISAINAGLLNTPSESLQRGLTLPLAPRLHVFHGWRFVILEDRILLAGSPGARNRSSQVTCNLRTYCVGRAVGKVWSDQSIVHVKLEHL